MFLFVSALVPDDALPSCEVLLFALADKPEDTGGLPILMSTDLHRAQTEIV